MDQAVARSGIPPSLRNILNDDFEPNLPPPTPVVSQSEPHDTIHQSQTTDTVPAAPPAARKRKRGSPYPNGSTPTTRPASPAIPQPDSQNVAEQQQQPQQQLPPLHVARGPAFTPADTSTTSPYFLTSDIPMNRQNYRYYPAGLPISPDHIVHRTIENAPAGCARVSWEDRSPFVKVTQDGLGLIGDKGFRSARCTTPIREGKWYFEVKIVKGTLLDGSTAPSTISNGANVRLGWGRREASLNGPVGLDGYSYGIRDRTGEKVTLSRPKPYGHPFGTGDVVGLYISLPPRRKPNNSDPLDPAHILRKRIPIHFKGQVYFESMEPVVSKEMNALTDYTATREVDDSNTPSAINSKNSTKMKNADRAGRGKNKSAGPVVEQLRSLPILRDSKIAYFVNGKSQGVAFSDIYSYLQLRPSKATAARASNAVKKSEAFLKERENPYDDGTLGYYPFISLFGKAEVRINPGPDFEFPPPPDIDAVISSADNQSPHAPNAERTWRPLSERATEFMAEMHAIDEQEEKEAQAARKLGQKLEKTKVEKDKRRREKDAERKRRKTAPTPKQNEQQQSSELSKPAISLAERFGPQAAGFIQGSSQSTPMSTTPEVSSDGMSTGPPTYPQAPYPNVLPSDTEPPATPDPDPQPATQGYYSQFSVQDYSNPSTANQPSNQTQLGPSNASPSPAPPEPISIRWLPPTIPQPPRPPVIVPTQPTQPLESPVPSPSTFYPSYAPGQSNFSHPYGSLPPTISQTPFHHQTNENFESLHMPNISSSSGYGAQYGVPPPSDDGGHEYGEYSGPTSRDLSVGSHEYSQADTESERGTTDPESDGGEMQVTHEDVDYDAEGGDDDHGNDNGDGGGSSYQRPQRMDIDHLLSHDV